MLAEVDRQDQNSYNKVAKLRAVAAVLRTNAVQLRKVLMAERSRRERMESYLAYWMRINPNWTYEEVWSGMIKCNSNSTAVEITTTDEENATEDSDDEPSVFHYSSIKYGSLISC